MHGEDYWRDPDEFDPERFIDGETNTLRRDERCIPFMIGRRFCIGQTLAEKQLFLFFVTLLQRFKFRAPGGPASVSTDPVPGFIHRCPEYSVDVRLRKRSAVATTAFVSRPN